MKLLESFNSNELAKIFYDLRESGDELWDIVASDRRKYGEYIRQLAETYDELSDIDKELAERITSTTAENVINDFMNSLYAFADGSEDVFEDVAENWQKMINRMVINNVIGNDVQNWANEWYDGWSKEIDNLNDELKKKNITEEEYKGELKRINAKYESLYNEELERTTAKTEQLKDIGAIKELDTVSSKDQEASRVAADKVTYEQMDEFTGILRAMQFSGERRNQLLEAISNTVGGISIEGLKELGGNPFAQMESLPMIQSPADGMGQQIAAYLETLNSLVSPNGTDVRDIRNMMITTNDYLLDIKRSNREILNTVGDKMDSIYRMIDDKL